MTTETLAAPMKRLHLHDCLDALIADGHLTPQDVAGLYTGTHTRARAEQHPLSIIAAQNWASHRPPHKHLNLEDLTRWFAARVGLPYFHIDPLAVDVPQVCSVVSHAYATRYKILPVALDKDKLTVATADPFNQEWISILSQALRLQIQAVVANPEDIVRYLAEFYSLSRSVKRATLNTQGANTGIANFEQLVELGKLANLDANNQHVIHIVDWLLQYAFEQRASDIHFEPRRELGLVRFRIDGVMHMVYQIPVAVMSALISRVKLLGRMDIVEKRRPQDGRIKTRSGSTEEEIELRLSTMPTAFGEKLVVRIYNPDVVVRSFHELGFNDHELNLWQNLVHQPHGILLVTGPTGSGKSTTLYSTMKTLATPEVNVCTLEDPIEMVMPMLNQTQVQPQLGLDFANGIRTLLRQDPDVIMVGEIRDRETAEMAIQAALTGHLVLSTMHTNDAPSAITRMLELGIPAYLLQATMLGIMAQRLVRTLCPHCKELGSMEPEAWKSLVQPWKAHPPAHIYHPVGCLECRMTGYLGRVGIYEMMALTSELRQAIRPEVDVRQFRLQAYKGGLKPLRINGAQKIAEGQTTLEEILKVVPPSEDWSY